MAAKIYKNFTADGDSSVYISDGSKATLFATGTFGSGTVKVNIALDGTNYISKSTSWQLTAAGLVEDISLPRGASVKLSLTGATNPDIKAYLK